MNAEERKYLDTLISDFRTEMCMAVRASGRKLDDLHCIIVDSEEGTICVVGDVKSIEEIMIQPPFSHDEDVKRQFAKLVAQKAEGLLRVLVVGEIGIANMRVQVTFMGHLA